MTINKYKETGKIFIEGSGESMGNYVLTRKTNYEMLKEDVRKIRQELSSILWDMITFPILSKNKMITKKSGIGPRNMKRVEDSYAEDVYTAKDEPTFKIAYDKYMDVANRLGKASLGPSWKHFSQVKKMYNNWKSKQKATLLGD